MGRSDATVGVDGSLYRFHPHFHDLMMEKTEQLVSPGIKVHVIMLTGSKEMFISFCLCKLCREIKQ
jgi:hexokinase